jgi:uncharacterized membrane protein YgcG
MLFSPALITAAALAGRVLSYEITSYYEETTTPIFTFEGGTSTGFYTDTTEVVVTGADAPTAITATTVVTTPVIGAPVTIVSALISPDIGEDFPATTSRTQYFVPITYSCGSDNAVTTQADLDVPPQVTGHLTPVSTTTSVDTLVSQSTIIQAYVDPADIEPIDLARASYHAQPSSCRRAITSIDYRALCSGSATSSRQVTRTGSAVPTATEISCGEMNPCCYGCHEWGWRGEFEVTADFEFYVCEDGKAFDLKGSETTIAPEPTQTAGSGGAGGSSGNGSGSGAGGNSGSSLQANLIGVGCFVVAVLSFALLV